MSTKSETLRLVPHSGIQFLSYGLQLKDTGAFSRDFIYHKLASETNVDGSVKIELQARWDDNKPDVEHPVVGGDEDDTISKDKAIDAFLNCWIPVPFLDVRPGIDEHGREILGKGPLNWARMRITAAEPHEPISHHIVFAFDTEIQDTRPDLYVALTPQNVVDQQEFALASCFVDLERFLSVGPKKNDSTWINQWLLDDFVSSQERSKKKKLTEDQKKTLEHLSRYVTLLQFLSITPLSQGKDFKERVSVPRVRLVNTYSEVQPVKPVGVDLVLDIGNSRTCGILIESFPNDGRNNFENTMVLELRDLGDPHLGYRDAFESHVELAQATFGSYALSRQISPYIAFVWPSPVRVGPEATKFRQRAKGGEDVSGMSSPKRYLCDLAPVNQPWRFQPADYDSQQNPPPIDIRVRGNTTARGDVKRQIKVDEKFYTTLETLSGIPGAKSAPGAQLVYSRSAMFTFMLTEIIAQAMSMINNPQVRKGRRESNAPRELRRIILSIPTAMPIQEQRILRSRAEGALKLVWDLMKWTEKKEPPPSLRNPPEVRVSWDEATCTQLVYLYNEIVDKFGGNVNGFFDLMGKTRIAVDPEQPKVLFDRCDPKRSLRIASVDIGGGTTDLMVTTYHVEGGHALVPIQNFREGFRIAGDDVLRQIIQLTLLPRLEEHLKAAGMSSAREFLERRFGGNKADMSVQAQHSRREFVLRVLQPAALALINAVEAVEMSSGEDAVVATVSLRRLLGGVDDGPNVISDRVRNYIEEEAHEWGATDFALETCKIQIDGKRLRDAVNSTLNDVFSNIAEAIHHLDCDVVLLSGRPSRMTATIDLFTNKLSVTPDRVVPFSRYHVGQWYPFAGKNFRIEDPKTATVVGSLLGVLVERHVPNFTVYTDRFTMRSTAKYMGQMENSGKLTEDKVFFKSADDPEAAAKEEGVMKYFAPTRLGYRQLPIERWTATPLYRLKLSSISPQSQSGMPYEVTLRRKPVTEIAEIDDKKIFEKEGQKEELIIGNVVNKDGAGGGLKSLFSLTLDTLPSDDGYWLDTGILTVG